MFSNVTVNPGVGSGLRRDSRLTDAMARLAKLRNPQNTPTNDVHAAFKEGERSPIREAAAA